MRGDAAWEDRSRFSVIIWNAGIMRSKPDTIERPGAIATKASRSMMMPNERVCRLCINQPSVKRSTGI
jgi:hypothetical protein